MGVTGDSFAGSRKGWQEEPQSQSPHWPRCPRSHGTEVGMHLRACATCGVATVKT